MESRIETSRLVIRTMDEHNMMDLLGVFGILGDEDTAWWADVEPFEDLEDAYGMIHWGNTNKRGITQYAVCDKESNFILGLLQVKASRIPNVSIAELGYAMCDKARGKGYMTEAVKAVCEKLFEDPTMTEVRCEILPFNDPSKGVAHRCGFTKVEQKWCEKEKRELDDNLLDEYVLSANDYRKRVAGFDYSYLSVIEKEEDLYEQLAA